MSALERNPQVPALSSHKVLGPGISGILYRLEGFAKDSETLEEMIVYRVLYGDGGL